MIALTTARHGVPIVADGEPYLRLRASGDVVGHPWTTHLGCDPTRFERVGQHRGPEASDREGEHNIKRFGIRVGLRTVPLPAPSL